MELFLIFAMNGIISGGVYLGFCFIRRLINFNKFIQFPLDIVCGLLIGFIFANAVFQYSNGVIEFYLVIAFILGIITTGITFKNFVATLSEFVYNINIRIKNKIVNKLFRRRKTDGARKINQNS